MIIVIKQEGFSLIVLHSKSKTAPHNSVVKLRQAGCTNAAISQGVVPAAFLPGWQVPGFLPGTAAACAR